MAREHGYTATLEWTGNRGEGTSHYRGYDRTWTIATPGKPPVPCSNDPLLGGDPTRHNPEDLMLAALSACHMLWYLHLCADAGVVVTDYTDDARGTMAEDREGGRFVEVTLAPRVTVAENRMVDTALALHETAHKRCFIANSVNFPVRHEPAVTAAS